MSFLINFKTKNLFIITKKNYFKIPFSATSFKNLKNEKNNFDKIKKDTFFKKFLIKERFFFFIKKSKKYQNLHQNEKKFLKNYISFLKFKKSKKKKIIQLDFFKNILIFLKEEKVLSKKLIEEFKNKSIKVSSNHGDFYYKNILEKNRKFFFIDWNNFQNNIPIYFDSINYIIFSKKNYSGSWFLSWKNNYKYLLKKFPKIYIKTYILCKISIEMKSNKFNKRLKNKFMFIIKEYFDFCKKN